MFQRQLSGTCGELRPMPAANILQQSTRQLRSAYRAIISFLVTANVTAEMARS